MNHSAEVVRASPSMGSDRAVPVLGIAALVLATASAVFAWRGGIWAAPLWLAAAIVAIVRSRGPWRSVATRLGVAAAAVSILVGGYAFAATGGISPALRTDSRTYSPGDTVEIRLKAGLRKVHYNLCGPSLVRLTGDAWGRVPPDRSGPNVICTLELRGLPPFFSATYEVDLRPDLKAGSYRLTTDVEVGGESRVVASNAFTIE